MATLLFVLQTHVFTLIYNTAIVLIRKIFFKITADYRTSIKAHTLVEMYY